MSKYKKVSVINLGCARNLVDAQHLLGHLKRKGCEVTEAEDADVVFINTCGFIDDAKQESIDTILDVIELKKQGKIKKIVLAGCLTQRYGDALREEFKEVDAIVGVPSMDNQDFTRQVSLTPAYQSYLKICESCYNHCSFCVIPQIKGQFTSRPTESILDEVAFLDARGVKEINVIGQDISAYGMDLYQDRKLAALLKQMTKDLKNIEWIRLLYQYPAHITDELIDVVANETKICKYMDIPLQHINDQILKRMNRKMTKQETVRLIEKIRKNIPGVFVRTSFIVGFPGETEEQFQELLDFVKAIRFERLGAFKYSLEEGTAAASLPDQVSDKIKQDRYDRLMTLQQSLAKEVGESFIHQTIPVIIDDIEGDQDDLYIGRTPYDAPEVDGEVFVKSQKSLMPGEIVPVLIKDAAEYDLFGEHQ